MLLKILKENSKSEIGKRFNFASIKSIEDFKRQVPITEYKFYEDYINRMATGEKNILTSDEVEYFGTHRTTVKQR